MNLDVRLLHSNSMPSFRSSLLALALSCGVSDAAALVSVPTLQPMLPAAGMEPNRGQTKAGILFLIPGSTSSMAVTSQSVLYSPLGVTLGLVASNSNPMVGFADPLPGLVNFYTGADSQKSVTGVPRYATANLAKIYQGVDARYTIAPNGALTLTLLFQPGVDPKAILFEIPQAVQIIQSSDGSLFVRLGTSPGDPALGYPPPLAFQTTSAGQVSRSASFSVQSTNTFGVAVQGLDTSLPSQISVNLGGATSYSSVSNLGTQLITMDSAGSTFFATTIADAAGKDGPFPATAREGCSADVGGPDPCTDVAIYKYSKAGVLAFVTYLSGQDQESSGFLGIAPDGTLVVAGTTDSPDFPVTPGALQTVYAGPPAAEVGGIPFSGDFFATRLDASTGLLQVSTYLGGPNGDAMGTAALGADGSLYFLPVSLGQFSDQMPVTKGALQSSCLGDNCQNGYVARLSASLDKLIFGTYLPGVAQATAQLYSDGSVYYGGTATAGFPTTPDAYQTQNAGGDDGIVARLDPSGSSLIFATYFGGPNTDWIYPIAVAPDGSVWAGVSSFMECCVNVQSQLIHLDASGSRLLADLPISPDQMTVDRAGNLFTLAQGPITVSPDALLGGSCGGDAYLELNASGQQLFATYLPIAVTGFAGTDTQGVPYLASSSGLLQVVQGPSSDAMPFAGCVVDAASFGVENAISPGEMVTIFGSGLGPTPGLSFQLIDGKVPRSLGGTQVLVNGEPAPILYSSYGQLNLILPYSLTIGTQPSIDVVTNGTSVAVPSETVQAAGISLFQINGAAVALNQDGTANTSQNPARPGSTVMLFGTGGGQTDPPSVAGDITPLGLRPSLANVQVEFLYLPNLTSIVLNPEYAGAAPELVSGVTQVNVTLPGVINTSPFYPPGMLPLLLLTNGQLSSNQTVTIFVTNH